jgi:acyl-CoA hydrolase
MKLHMHRGIQPVDAQFNKTTHINPIHIDDIIQFNGNTVKL